MKRYVARRMVQIIATLLIYLTLLFFILQALPGDITSLYVLNPEVPPEAREALRQRLGLDRPLYLQYLSHVKNFFTGNFGVSFSHYPRPVIDVILERLPRTVFLFLTATLISFYLGFVLGKVIAWRRGERIDYAATIGGVSFYTVFTPLLALILIWMFAFKLGWFPINKFIDPLIWRNASVNSNTVFSYMILSAGVFAIVMIAVRLLTRRTGRLATRRLIYLVALVVGVGVLLFSWNRSGVGHLAFDILRHLVLPVVTITLVAFGGTMLLMRDSMLETIREDYVMAARAKGLPERVVRDKHAARTALLPVVTSFVLSIGFVVDGGIITETVFSWPGIGLTLLQSVTSNDIPLALGAFVFTGVFALIAHLVADVMYAYLDPRISYDRPKEG
ncbi:MAG: ABC transporter permease [Candidatus Bipolaricaulia bacterium]